MEKGANIFNFVAGYDAPYLNTLYVFFCFWFCDRRERRGSENRVDGNSNGEKTLPLGENRRRNDISGSVHDIGVLVWKLFFDRFVLIIVHIS